MKFDVVEPWKDGSEPLPKTLQKNYEPNQAYPSNRFSEARDKAARKLTADGNTDLAAKVRQFQFRDIRPKAASEIEDISQASRLLGHSKEDITKRVYRRVGEVVSPTK
ncbi:hypothetical protein [Pseudomonas sp. BJa3]|uniref:hypothetical protein n=1 Tax=Pseudomonas sp. BJa3 TaxID=2986525 RepID=UPI0022657FFA|nr:hypothetical protein [Pseudomonas sp. BJa3]